MAIKFLGERQLFSMKRGNLEKRISQYYSETHDTESEVEYGVAVLLFNTITMDNYSFVCKDLFKELFMTAGPTDHLRDYCLYFYDFFTYDEWEVVRDRLFKNLRDFSEWTRKIRPETAAVRAAVALWRSKMDRSSPYRSIGGGSSVMLRWLVWYWQRCAAGIFTLSRRARHRLIF